MKILKIRDLIEIDTAGDKIIFITNDADFKGKKAIDIGKRNNLEADTIAGKVTVERWDEMEDYNARE